VLAAIEDGVGGRRQRHDGQSIEADFTADEIAIAKRLLVESAVRTERLDKRHGRGLPA
jgi:hypothetical protein